MIYLLTAFGLSPGGSTHLHTNNTSNNTKQTIRTTTQQFWKSAGRALSWLVLPWHLPYNRGKSKKLQAWHRQKKCWSCRYVQLAKIYTKMTVAWLSIDFVEGIKHVRWPYKVTITIYKATTACKHAIWLVLFSFTKNSHTALHGKMHHKILWNESRWDCWIWIILL